MNNPDIHELQTALAQVALAVFTEKSLKADLERLVGLTCRFIPACSAGSIALLVDGEPTTAAISEHVALELDIVQYDNGEGPCLTALGGNTVRFAVLADDEQFPHFAVGAADRRIAHVLSKPIRHHDQIIGTLNLYSHDPDGFDTAAEQIADIAAAEAATAVVVADVYNTTVELRQQLQGSYDQVAQVAQAHGALIALHACSTEQAEALLTRAATATGDSLIDVAQRILNTLRNDAASDSLPTMRPDQQPPPDL